MTKVRAEVERKTTLGQLRLRVLNSLPQSHQLYLREEILSACRGYLRSKGVPDISPSELLSEVWLKLLGALSLPDAESLIAPNDATTSDDPSADGRVAWLSAQVGGAVALDHRCVDIRRKRHGRGHRTDQGVPDDFEDPGSVKPLEASDLQYTWDGLLATAKKHFGNGEDVSRLLDVFEKHPDVIDASSGTQWPVSQIVILLNRLFPPPDWTDRRVDQAKRRLKRWIQNIQRDNGLDTTDLEALFAKVGRGRASEMPLMSRRTRTQERWD